MTTEQAILSCMLNDVTIAKEAASRLVVYDFVNDANRKIFKAIEKNIEDGVTPDIITVTRHCKELAIYITEISSELVSTVNYQEYISILIEEGNVRRLHESMAYLVQLGSTEEIIERISDEINYVQNRMISIEDYATHKTVNKSLLSFEERAVGKNPGINTPLPNLTSYTGGWQPSDLIIIAARPSVGKTAFALACVQKAIEQDKSIVFFSLEMVRERLMDRLIVGYSGVDAIRYKLGKLDEHERSRIYDAAEGLKSKHIIINDRGSIGLTEIEAFATARRKEGKCDMVIVDYLQLMKVRADKSRTRDGELSEISRGLKLLARDLNVPVIALSQLNRQVEQRGNKKPMLSDLRESGAIEQDADIVLLLYRAAYYGERETMIDGRNVSAVGVGEVIIAKHRNGNVGSEFFSHNDSMTRITEYKTQSELTINNYYDTEPDF